MTANTFPFSNTVTQVGFDQKTTIPYTARMKFVPKLRYQGGFVRAGGVFLKRDYYNGHKSSDRVREDLDLGRTDQIRDSANRNAGAWDWARFKRDSPGAQWYLDTLAQPEQYTVYVKGKWEGLTGKMVVSIWVWWCFCS